MALITVLLFGGCSLASRQKIGRAAELKQIELAPGKGDAYLFDLKIYREGKKNSVRLDVYRTRDTISIFARGYLGKGVLKGLITSDFIKVYFPTENEYYSGKIIDIISGKCVESFPFEKMIIDLFLKTPPELDEVYGNFYINIQKETGKERKYKLSSKKCNESIEIEYDLKENRFIPKAFSFNSEDNTFRFKASRRKKKLNIQIPGEKFKLDIPESAIRIIPKD